MSNPNHRNICRQAMLLFTILSLLLLANGYVSNPVTRDVETVFQWNVLDYGFPTEKDRQDAVSNGNLVPSNGVPIDVLPYYGPKSKSKIFVTIPRFQEGIPFSLATVNALNGANPVLQAYPNYDLHKSHGADCTGITSAFRVAITECNQMWVIDSGIIGTTQRCPPQLLLFDLNTDTLLHRYQFSNNTYIPSASLLITPVVVVKDPPPRGSCKNAMVYVADVSYHGLVMYNYQQNTAWRAENKFMYPDPTHGTHTIAGESFILMDGIFGMASDKRNLYFHPLASISEYAVPLSVLDNKAIWDNNLEAAPNQFRLLGKRNSECAAEAIDSVGNIYCVTLNPIKLISWNVQTSYQKKNLREIPARPELLEFVSGMKVVRNNMGKEELWMISNRFQKIALGTQRSDEVNFRILKRPIEDLQLGFGLGNDLHNKLVFN